MTFNYGDIIEYIDCTYDPKFEQAKQWCKDNEASFDELVDRRTKIKEKLHRYFQINEIPTPPEPTPAEAAKIAILHLEAEQTNRLIREAINDIKSGLTNSFALDKLTELDEEIAQQRKIITGDTDAG